jgi:hypothetical protein
MDSGVWFLQPKLSSSPFWSMGVESWTARLEWQRGKTAEYGLRATGAGARGDVLWLDLAAFDLPTDATLLDFTIDVVPAEGAPATFRFRDLYSLPGVPASWVGYKGYSRPQTLTSVRIPLPWDTEIRELLFRFDGTEKGVVLPDNVVLREEASR